jgi:phage terminase large subunit
MIPTIAPTWQQHLAWEKLQDSITDEVLFGGGAGGGKSWLGAEWEITQCLMYPGVRYFIGRDELKKIRQSTVVTIYKVLRHHRINPDSIFRFNGQDNAFKFRNGSQIDLLELKFIPSDPLFERFGSLEYTGGMIEEGGEVDEDGKSMICSRVGRHMNDHYGLNGTTLITCNPKKNWLYYNFYLPWKEGSLAEDKAFIQALAKHNMYGESGYIKRLEKFTGAMGARLRDGNWEYENDPACLIETDAIGRCFKDFTWAVDDATTKYYITCDVARQGKDFTVIGIWKGWHCRLYKFAKFDTVATANKIKEFMAMYGVPVSRVVVDADGVGGGVVDQLRCMQFINNSRPLPAPINPARDKAGKAVPENYANLKAQCYYRSAEKVNMDIMKISIETGNVEREKVLAIEEMEQVKRKKLDGDGKMDVVDREGIIKMIGRSPDYWSAIMMRAYFDIMPKQNIWAA